jgi:hypothetical protein
MGWMFLAGFATGAVLVALVCWWLLRGVGPKF